MRVKTIVDEDFTNYKKVSMFIGTISCGGKCCHEANLPPSICHNEGWKSAPIVEISNEDLFARYVNNPLTEGIVIGGLEPFEQFEELKSLVEFIRTEKGCDDDIVIYTGYTKEELSSEIALLELFPNMYVKFGRFIPNDTPRYDPVLGVILSSSNQVCLHLGKYF